MSVYPSHGYSSHTSGYHHAPSAPSYTHHSQQYYQQAPPPPPPPQYQQHQHQPSYYQQQHYPPQQPDIANDPAAFRHFYGSRLSSLTINSRPIIQDLSMQAMTHAHKMSGVVVQCIESHIRNAAPEFKLPPFYLLDSITKNIFNPYANQFAPVIVRLFIDTYHAVDASTRSKMEEMLVTWRTGAPGGRELFGANAQSAIERSVWGSGSSSESGPRHPTKAQVLTELEVTLSQKEQALRNNRYDTQSAGHIEVLQQLRNLLHRSAVSPSELTAILNQLRQVARATASSAPTPQQAPPPPPPPPPPAPRQPLSYPPPAVPVAPSSYQSAPAPHSQYSHAPVSAPLSQAPVQVPAAAISDLFSSLVKSGLITAPATTSASQSVKENKPLDPSELALREYERAILSMPIKLTTTDIAKQQPQIVPFLYSRLPLQCKQCGIRFSDAADGKKRMEDHLDMHFRQNRKANQTLGRGHSRSWFVGIYDWVHDGGKAGGSGPKAAAAAAAAEREAELRKQYVVVPPGEEAKPAQCPICKEYMKSEFLEDDEDWVWKNAVRVQDKVYHATCHSEASSSLAARLRNENSTGRSRSVTPDHLRSSSLVKKGSKSPEPRVKSAAGAKRKVEEMENDLKVKVEASGTPPLKKIALAPA